MYQGTSSSEYYFSGYVNAQSANEVRLTRAKGALSVGGLLIGANSGVTRTVVRKDNPEFQPYTGDILYTENIVKTERTDGQAENLKFVSEQVTPFKAGMATAATVGAAEAAMAGLSPSGILRAAVAGAGAASRWPRPPGDLPALPSGRRRRLRDAR